MINKIIAALLLSVATVSAVANEANVKKAIETAYPRIKVDSVTKTPFTGLYEVFMGGQIIYADEKLTFIFADGKMIDPKSKRDLTGERLEELTKIDFKSLPLDQAIKIVKGDGSRKLVVFSDVDCPYCKRLERRELSTINNVTIYTFLYPIAQLHPDAATKSKSIWCAKERERAWNDWIIDDKLPDTVENCKVPLEAVGKLAAEINVQSTPTMFFADGRRMMGSQPAVEIEKALNKASKKLF